MAHNNTALSQLLKLVPRHEFERDAAQHHQGRKLRKMTRWNQFVAMSWGRCRGGAACATSWPTWPRIPTPNYHCN